MKTLLPILGTGKLLWVLIPCLSIWNVHGKETCSEQLYIKRGSIHFVSEGDSIELECPVTYCTKQPNVTWCKLNGTQCSSLRVGLKEHTRWVNRKSGSSVVLHFEEVIVSDNGSYQCKADTVSSGLITSHWVTINVTARTQNNSEHLILNTTSASGPHSKDEMADQKWLLCGLLSFVGLSLLFITCFCLACTVRKHQEKQKKSFDSTGREINLAVVVQPFGSEQNEVSTRQNSQILSSETGIYDNEPQFKAQERPEVYSKPCLEENKENIVYASLNHSVTGLNPRPVREVKEAPTEYAAIFRKS